jgi:hypothetical protein
MNIFFFRNEQKTNQAIAPFILGNVHTLLFIINSKEQVLPN